jgi:hypothetical protein
MSKLLFYKRYIAGPKDRCRYCWRMPDWINENPEFHFDALACHWCVTEGPCTPRFRTIDTYDIGNMTYHVGHGCHKRGYLINCRWCRAETNPPKKRVRDDEKDEDYKPPKKARQLVTTIKYQMPHEIIIDCSDC